MHALYGMYTVGEIMLYNFYSPHDRARRGPARARAFRERGIFKSGRPVTHPHRPHPHRLHSQRRRLAAGSSRSPCTLQQTRLRTSAFVPAPEWPRGDEISNCVRRGRPRFGIHAAAVLRSEPIGWPWATGGLLRRWVAARGCCGGKAASDHAAVPRPSCSSSPRWRHDS